MRWVYILECCGGYFYVGETKRLYRRMWEHSLGRGGANSLDLCPESIVAIYKVHHIVKFVEVLHETANRNNIYFNRTERLVKTFDDYDEKADCEQKSDALFVENHITERLMSSLGSRWRQVRGGRYVRRDCNYQKPNDPFESKLPLCNCKLPCDVAKNHTGNYLYFRCAKKNMWDGLAEAMEDSIDVDGEACDFFAKHVPNPEDEAHRRQLKRTITGLSARSPWLASLVGMYEHCVGGCGKGYDGYNTVRYWGKAINLCFDCFMTKHTTLADKYGIRKCLIDVATL